MTLRLLTAFALTLALGACQSAPASQQSGSAQAAVASTPAPSPRALTLVTMGASDVTGIGADDPATQSWAPVLAGMLEGKVTHVRLGSPGWTAKQIRANALDKAVKAQPDDVVLMTGMNDFNAGVGLEDFKADLGGILTGLAATGAKVYVINMPDLNGLPAFKAASTPLSLAIPLWQSAIRDTAEAHGASVVELSAYSDEIARHPEYISADGFHPSTRGYARLASIVAAAMAR